MFIGLPRQFWAALSFFLIFGALFGLWGAHLPSIEDRIGDSETALGLALLCASVGLIIAAPLVAPLSKRVGTAKLLVAAWCVYLIAVSAVFWVHSVQLLMLYMFFVGLMGGLIDVCVNAQVAITERETGRPLLSRAHAVWSLGGALVAGTAIWFLSLGLRDVHITGALAVLMSVSIWASMNLYSKEHEARTLDTVDAEGFTKTEQRQSISIWTSPVLLLMGLIALFGLVVESGIMEWLPIYFADFRGESPAGTAMVFAVFSLVMFVARMLGDELKKHVREKHILVGGAILSGGALALGLFVDNNHLAMAVMSLAAVGIAFVYPLVTSRAAAYRVPGQSNEAAAGNIAVVTGVGYCALLIGPPVIGLLSEMVSHWWGIFFVASCGPVMAVLAALLPRQSKSQDA